MARTSLLTVARRGLGLAQGLRGRGLEVVPNAGSVRRGETLEVAVRGEGPLEAGLVCTETYASFLPSKRLARSDRAFIDALAYEGWVPVDGPTVALTIPPDAPYSYDGEQLKFTWRAGVRQSRSGLDAVRMIEIQVLP